MARDDPTATVIDEETLLDSEPGNGLPPLFLDWEGVREIDPSTGATQLRRFGTERAFVEKLAADALKVDGSRSSNDECGAGPMEFTSFGSVTLNFQDGKFVGWFAEGRDDLGTINEVKIGGPRADVEKIDGFSLLEDSTLGAEFSIEGDVSGFFEVDAKGWNVASLFAGTNCFFR
ncbi:hypothetical protein GCM10023115_15280 [Pontixanthobacter gangjinensis]